MNTKTFQKNFEMLNPEQREAVETLDGPVMVIAGPGTGKTQIIGMRTANIILKSWVNPENILITTFTEAGVIAIRERLLSMIGAEAHKVQVSTVHSFSQEVIKTFPEKFTIEKLDIPIDDIETMEILSTIVSDLLKTGKLEYLMTYGDPLFYVQSIKSSIGDLKREGISPAKFQKTLEEETERSLNWLEEKRNNKRIKKIEKYEREHEEYIGKLRELWEVFHIYQDTLRKKRVYDFNDMINFVLERFHSDDDILHHYAESYQYIMLDEYQDTNNPQNEIIDLILSLSEKPNIMVVGDDDQSIYRFQGANIENMLDFTTKYPDSKIIILDKNYRSTQEILNLAENLIEHNNERLISRLPGLKKSLNSQKKWVTEGPTLYRAISEIDERVSIKNQIQKLIQEWIPLCEIAVIVRSNIEVQYFSEFLTDYKIDVSSKLQSDILSSDWITLIIKFLNILHKPYESERYFIDVLRSSLVPIDNMDVITINTYIHRENYASRGNKLQIFDVLRSGQILQTIQVTWKHEIHDFLDKYIEVQEKFSQSNVLLAFWYFLKTFGVLELVEKHGSFDDLQDIYTLYREIKKWTSYAPSSWLETVLERIDLHKKYNYRILRQSQDSSWEGIQVTTAHGAKGLEYEHVFIPWLYSGNWDNKATRKLIKLPELLAGSWLQFAELWDLSDAEKKNQLKTRQLEEDRRLFFVALTRAKSGLHLSLPAWIWGKAKIMSPFLSELWEVDIQASNISSKELEAEIQRELSNTGEDVIYSDAELDYIVSFLWNYKLSPSDLNAFLLEPRDFLYRTILRYPFEENENSIFGTMYHRTLELFYKKILETGEIQDYWYLEYVFLRQLEREYLSWEEQSRLKKRWLESLKWYFEFYQWTFRAPLKTEYRFSRRNIFFDGIPITGIIDKIELLDENYNENISGWTLFSQTIKITDYKTGSAKYIWDIKGQDKEGNKDEWYERGRYGRQLMFYKLLFENDFELSSHYSLWSLELDFCEGKKGNYKRVEVEFSDEEYEDFKRLVKETYTKMTDIEFWKEYLR